MTHPGVLLSLEEQTNGETHLCEQLSFALSLHREPGTTGEWEWDGENRTSTESGGEERYSPPPFHVSKGVCQIQLTQIGAK